VTSSVRIAIGSLIQEGNSFAPESTTLETFAAYYLWRGEEMLTGYGEARVEVPGFLDVLRAAGATPVPLLAGSAGSGGPLTRGTFETLLMDLATRLRAALPLDGVLLALHGAMLVEGEPDPESAILYLVRTIVGPEAPIGVSLDLHAHVTPRMVEIATFIIGYQEYPHRDMYETGQRTARLLLQTLRGERHPVMALAKRPLLLTPVRAYTAEGPLKAVADHARALEDAGHVLHASLFPVQPWLDVPDLGFAALVVADGDQEAARTVAEELAGRVWAIRASFEPGAVELEEAIRIGLAAPDGLTVVADAGDAPTSGSSADSTAVLRALLAADADRAARRSYLTLCGPDAARVAASAGVGQDVHLRVGRTRWTEDDVPLSIAGRVRTLSDGVFTMTGAGAQGLEMHMGLTAVLALGSIRLAIRSLPAMEWDPGIYTSVGLDPREAALVFVKSPAHFRLSFGPLAARILVADTPGAARINMRRIPFKHVTRPLYPLDTIE
jgi:microcystin degradation protein MlrC